MPRFAQIRRTMLALLYALAGSAVNEGYNYGQLIVALAEVWRSFDDEPFLAIVLKGLRGALLLGRTGECCSSFSVLPQDSVRKKVRKTLHYFFVSVSSRP